MNAIAISSFNKDFLAHSKSTLSSLKSRFSFGEAFVTLGSTIFETLFREDSARM